MAILFMLIAFLEPWRSIKNRNCHERRVLKSISLLLNDRQKTNFLYALGEIFKNIQRSYKDTLLGILGYQNHLEFRGAEWAGKDYDQATLLSIRSHIDILRKAIKKKDKYRIFIQLIILNYIGHYLESYPTHDSINPQRRDQYLNDLADDIQELNFDRYSYQKICLLREKWLKLAFEKKDVSIFMIAKYVNIFKIRFPSTQINSRDIGELEYHLWGFLKGFKENNIHIQYTELEALINLGKIFRILA